MAEADGRGECRAHGNDEFVKNAEVVSGPAVQGTNFLLTLRERGLISPVARRARASSDGGEPHTLQDSENEELGAVDQTPLRQSSADIGNFSLEGGIVRSETFGDEPHPEDEADRAASDEFISIRGSAADSRRAPQESAEIEPPVWCSERARDENVYTLHDEILDFAKFMCPTKAEFEQRVSVVESLELAIRNRFPDYRVEPFGSFATKTFLPHSDIDISILVDGEPTVGTSRFRSRANAKLAALGKYLVKLRLATKLEHIRTARVPILKFTHPSSGLPVDLSYNVRNGPENTPIVQRTLASEPMLRPLLYVLKQFLRQRGLNETFTGGFGSYLTLLLSQSVVQMIRRQCGRVLPDLGRLVTTWMRFYGIDFNYALAGVDTRHRGGYFSKRNHDTLQYEDPFLLSIFDPQDSSRDLGTSNHGLLRIRKTFAHAFHSLIHAERQGLHIFRDGWSTGRAPHTFAPQQYRTPLEALIAEDSDIVERARELEKDTSGPMLQDELQQLEDPAAWEGSTAEQTSSMRDHLRFDERDEEEDASERALSRRGRARAREMASPASSNPRARAEKRKKDKARVVSDARRERRKLKKERKKAERKRKREEPADHDVTADTRQGTKASRKAAQETVSAKRRRRR